MLITCRKEFQVFLLENSRVYPYRDIPTTRNRMYVSWMLMKRYEHTGSIGRIAGVPVEAMRWVAIPSNAFDIDTVTHLYISKQALPVPSTMGEIVDALECWGKALDIQWYNRSMRYLGYLLSNGFQLNRETMVNYIVQLRVLLMIDAHAADLPYDTILDEFADFFPQEYCHSKMFSTLCLVTFDHLDLFMKALSSIQMTNDAGAAVPVTPPAVVSSSSLGAAAAPMIVPSSVPSSP